MPDFINLVTMGTVLLLIISLTVYGIVLLIYLIERAFPGFDLIKRVFPCFENQSPPNNQSSSSIVKLVESWPPQAFELPMSAVAAFAIVSLLRDSNPTNDPELSFKAFDLEFTGPAVPTSLWVVVYLTIIVSFKLLKKR